jgi:beta-glucanase (GH16 family)
MTFRRSLIQSVPGNLEGMKRRQARWFRALGPAVAVGVVASALWPATPVLAPTPARAPRLLFFDNFSGTSLDGSKWNTYITSRAANGRPWNDPEPSPAEDGSGMGCVDSAQYYLPGQVRVDNGLELRASKSSTPGWCNQTASSSTFPWRSGAVSTYSHFQFNGGYVAITMKAPSGNGMWPALWMLPGPGGKHGDDSEIDVQEGGFDPPGPAGDTFAWHLRQASGSWGAAVDTGINLSSGYHTYAINWISGRSITWYLDGREVGDLTNGRASIPNEPMELIMDLAVANAQASAWHLPYDAGTPSPSVLQVASVQVWSAPPK